MTKIFINAENGVFGRIGSFAAKQALLGNDVVIVNSEKALISGDRYVNIERRKFLRALNSINPENGPFFSKVPEKIMKRCIRGMIPDYRIGRGRVAFKKVMCYSGMPEEFKNEKFVTFQSDKLPAKVMTIGDLSRSI